MTADVVSIDSYDPGKEAWDRLDSNRANDSLVDRRAAAIYAAQQTAKDENWLTFARAHRIYESVPRLAALHDIDANWRELVAACRAGFGLRMAQAVDALIGGTAS